ncbi:MAG TPA: LamG domain-containing protein, partial [Elusimicrobiota bacterium]|nr:LamG domain-containing protein [Elusimicrobiota bacterium]
MSDTKRRRNEQRPAGRARPPALIAAAVLCLAAWICSAPPAFAQISVTNPTVSSATTGPWLPDTEAAISNNVSMQFDVQDPTYGLLVTTTQPAGLSIQWHFDEPSGTSALDASGHSDKGVFVGGPSFIIAHTGYGMSLNGSSQYLYSNNTFTSPLPFTIMCWFNTSSPGGKLIGFGNVGSGQSSNYDRHIYMGSSGQIYFGVYPGSVKTIVSGNGYDDGNWHFVAASLGPAGMKLYIDGVKVAGNTGVTTAQSYTGYWKVGYDNLNGWTGAAGNYFNGSIDEVKIYSTTQLTDQEVNALYTDTLAGNYNGSAFYGMYSTDGGTSWGFIPGADMSMTGTNGTTAAQTLQISNLNFPESTPSPGSQLNQVAIIVNDSTGAASEQQYTVIVDSEIAPAISTPTAPINDISTSVYPSLAWAAPSSAVLNTLVGPTKYDIEISSNNDPNFNAQNIFLNTTITATPSNGSYTLTSALPSGNTFYWRVQTQDGLSGAGPWSESGQFQTYPAPSISNVYVTPSQAWLSTGTFKIVVLGQNFLDLSPSQLPIGSLLKGGAAQSDITVATTTFVSPNEVDLTATLVSPSGSYDVKVLNPDGQYAVENSTISIPAPTLSGVYMVGAPAISGGVEPEIPDCTSNSYPGSAIACRPTRQLYVTGSGFENWPTSSAGVTLSGGGIVVASTTYQNQGLFVANVNVTTAAAQGLNGVTVVNADKQTSSLIPSTFTVTVPTGAIDYPAVGVTFPGPGTDVYANNLSGYYLNYSSGVAQIEGTAGFLPNSGQTSLSPTQVKITRLSDGYVWDGALFVSPTGGFPVPASENQWQPADLSETTPWNYSSWPNNGTYQGDGVSYNVAVRGVTQDLGWSYPISSFTVTIDRSPPNPTVANPVGGTVVNSQTSISLAADDSLGTGIEGVGVSTMEVVIYDTNTLSWNGTAWNVSPGLQWLTASSNPQMQWSPPLAPVSANITSFTGIKLPTWNNGQKYTVQEKVIDEFGQQATSPPVSFFYDVNNPTVTLTSPVVSQSSATPTWLNTLASFSGAIDDPVLDISNAIKVYVQVVDLTNNQFMTAGDTFTATAPNSGDNYWYNPIVANNTQKTWTDAISGVPFGNGHKYLVSIYVCNGTNANNPAPGTLGCTGGNGSTAADPFGSSTNNPPEFTGFFNFTNLPPTSVQVFPTVGALPNGFGDDGNGHISVSDLYGTAQDGGGTAGIQYEEYQLADVSNCGTPLPANINTCADFWFSADTAPGNSGTYVGDAPPAFYALNVGDNPPWNVAGTTMTGTDLQWEVWHATGIPWSSVDGHEFELITRAIDNAGNVQVTYSTTVFTYDSQTPTTAVSAPSPNEAFSVEISSISGTVADAPSPYNAGVFKTFIGVQRQSDGEWWTASGWSPTRADIATSLNTGVSPNTWAYNIPASFWTPIAAESPPADRFLVYAWSEDNVQNEVVSSTPSVENVESSATAKIAFEYDVVPPSSTVSVPVDQDWYSNVAPYTLPNLTGTAVDNPSYTQVKSSADAAGLSEVKVEIRDETDCILNSYSQCAYWTGSQWQEKPSNSGVFNLANIPINGNPNYSTWTFSIASLISGGYLVSSHQYRIRTEGIDSAVDANGNPSGNTESPPDVEISQDATPGSYANVHFFQWDSSAPATVIQSPVDGSQQNSLTSISGTAEDIPAGNGNNAGLGTTYIAICQSNTGSCTGSNSYLTALSGGSFVGTNPTWFPVTPSCSSGINSQCSWALSTTGVSWAPGQYYNILAYSTDVVNNAEAPLATDAANSNHVQFKYVGGVAAGHIETPSTLDATFPWYEPGNLATISGTAQGGTDAWIVLEDTDTQQYWSSFQDAWVNVSTIAHAGSITGNSWSYAFGSGNWQVNHNYFVGLVVCNASGGSCSSNSCDLATPANCLDRDIFVIDSSAPVVAVTLPSDGGAYRAGTLSTLSGTINDPTAPNQANSLNVGSVYFTVTRVSDNDQWSESLSTFTGNGGTGTKLYASAGGGGLFTYTTSYLQAQGVFKDGYQYQVDLFASDLAGNAGAAAGVGSTFRWDVTVPTAAVTVPISPPVYANSLPAISGTAIDPNPYPSDPHSAPSGLSQVGVLLRDETNGGYFNGSAFTSPAPSTQTVACTGQSCNWSYAPAGFDGEVGDGFYTLTVIARDEAGNTQHAFGINFSSFTFAVDKTAPNASISFPVSGADYSSATISAQNIAGVATDPTINGVASGINGTDGIDIQMWCLQAGTSYYWTGSSWLTGVSTLTLPGSGNPTNWNLLALPSETQWSNPTLGVGDTTFYLQVRAHDASTLADGTVSPSTGNVSAWDGPISFIVDDTTPTATLVWPASGSYVDALSSMTGTMYDNLSGVNFVQVRVTTNPATGPDWNGSAYTFAGIPIWRTVSLYSSSWTYPGGTGDTLSGAFASGQTYDLEMRAQDNSGNLSPPAIYTVIYDTIPVVSAPIPSYNGSDAFAGYLAGVSEATGTWSDPAGLSTIEVAVKDNRSGNFWEDGTGFTSFSPANSWIAAAIYPSSWAFTDAGLSAAIANITQPDAYTFYARAVDTAGNATEPASPAPSSGGTSVDVDFFPPTSAASSPAPNSYVNTLITQIQGTADDQAASSPQGIGVNTVSLEVFRVGTASSPCPNTAPCYWNLTTWQGGYTGFNMPTTGGSSWQTSALGTSMFGGSSNEGYSYSIVAQGTDLLGNVQTSFSTTTFIVDYTTPTVTMAEPTAPEIYISTAGLALSSGTFTDTTPGSGGLIPSGVKKVVVELEDVSGGAHSGGGQWWNANTQSWGAETSTTAVIYQSSWVFTALPSDWTRGDLSPDGRAYVLRVMAVDNAGNTGVFPNTNVAAATLVFDGSLPQAGISSPADGSIATSLAAISGTATDLLVNGSSSGVNAVYLSIENAPSNSDSQKNHYYDAQGDNWSSLTPVWNATSWNGTNWTFSSASINATLVVNDNYILISTAVDNAGNIQSPLPTSGTTGYAEVKYQPPPAATTITIPQKLLYYNVLSNIQGTANGNTAYVDLQIQRDDTVPPECWGGNTGNGWESCGLPSATLNGTPTAGNWSFPFYSTQTIPSWINNTSYTVTETGYNSVNLAESPSQSALYYIDESSPIASVGYPSNGSYLNTPPISTGTAQDQVINNIDAGILDPNGVSIQLQRTSDNDYWNQQQSTWTASYVFGQSTATYFVAGDSWSFTADVSTLAWQDGTTYKIAVQAEDKAQGGATGNIETLTAPITFTYDTKPPNVAITQPSGPQNARQSQLGTIAGNASVGEAPLSQVQVRVYDVFHNAYANPAQSLTFNLPSNQADSAWFAAPGGVSWSTAAAIPFVEGSTYSVEARAEDEATNYSVPYATYTFVYDSLPPVTSVAVPANGSYVNSLPAITGTVQDQPASNPGTIQAVNVRIERLSDEAYWGGNSWGPIADLGLPGVGVNIYTSSWDVNELPTLADLTSGTSYYITAASTDNAIPANLEAFGNAFSSTFTFDNTAPTSVVSVPVNNTFYGSLGSLSGTAQGAVPDVGVSTVALSIEDIAGADAGKWYDAGNNSFDLGSQGAAWFAAQGSTQAWSYNFGTPPWANVNTYVAYS